MGEASLTKAGWLRASVALSVVFLLSGFAVYGAIGDKYTALQREAGPLGPPLSDEADAPGGGRFNNFKWGAIYWHPSIGAFAVYGDIFSLWNAIGRTNYGYPLNDETGTPDGRGRYNHFRSLDLPNHPEASLYWTPQTGAHEIYGAIRDTWASRGWERGPFGYPVTGEFQDGQYRRSNFERGTIRWTARCGTEEIPAGVASIKLAIDGNKIKVFGENFNPDSFVKLTFQIKVADTFSETSDTWLVVSTGGFAGEKSTNLVGGIKEAHVKAEGVGYSKSAIACM